MILSLVGGGCVVAVVAVACMVVVACMVAGGVQQHDHELAASFQFQTSTSKLWTYMDSLSTSQERDKQTKSSVAAEQLNILDADGKTKVAIFCNKNGDPNIEF